MQLLAKQHKTHAVSRELDDVPNSVAPKSSDGLRVARAFNKAHRYASSDRRKNAGAMKCFREEVATKRNQETDQDLRTTTFSDPQ